MKGQKYLGIYAGEETATVVCLSLEGRKYTFLGSFSVSSEGDGAGLKEIAALIAKNCAEKLPIDAETEVTVSLDCSLFMQHNVHSEFQDIKQIRQTVRFDTEEALASDISESALSFEAISSDDKGSSLTVFTVRHKIMSDILLSLQSNNIDPVSVEPDVHSLTRYILHNSSADEVQKNLYGILSRDRGYFLVASQGGTEAKMPPRTFLLKSGQDRNTLIQREIPLTMAMAGGLGRAGLYIYDSTDSVDPVRAGQALGIEAKAFDLASQASGSGVNNCDPVGFAIAYGAALAHTEKNEGINFREDYLPYQGRRVQFQNAVKILSIILTILVLAIGVKVHLPLLERNNEHRELLKKFSVDYLAIMVSKTQLPGSLKTAKKTREDEFKRIRQTKSGLNAGGTATIQAKLTLVLKAFNKCAAQTNLVIDKITVSDKNVLITGKTSNRNNTLKFLEAVKEDMEISNVAYK
ncbi:MAG: hypothetical protein E4H40_08010, partial [Candidatus Brocadiia bacterium]